MGALSEVRSAPALGNGFLDGLVADTVFREGITIRYALQGSAGTSGFTNNGGALWAQDGAVTAYTQAVAAWNAVSNLNIQPYNTYYNGVGGLFGPGGITWVAQLVRLTNSDLLGDHELPAVTRQTGRFNTAHPYWSAANNVRGGFSFTTFVHEIGHALGLLHPHDSNTPFPGVSDENDVGDNGLNRTLYTVMSYVETLPDGSQSPSRGYGWQATPGAFDIAAVQALYGANMNTATGDTVYRLPDSNAVGTFFSCIWDAGGTDTITADGVAQPVTIDLRPATLADEDGGGGFLSRASGIYGGFTIAANAVIENAWGGNANDTLRGNDSANQLIGGNGPDALYGGGGDDALDGGDGFDFLDGGPGADTLIGGAGSNSYVVDNTNDVIFEDASGPDNDVVRATASFYLSPNLENLYLDGPAFFGVGNAGANRIEANNGNNLLIGGAGNDTILAFDGNDSLFGESGDDRQVGGTGIDYLVGGAGADTLDGGNSADALYGESGDDSLIGGYDFVTDILVGGDGDDTLDGVSSFGDYDLMDGGGGNDSYRVDTPADLTFEAPDGGIDTVYAVISGAGYYLYPNVENLVLDSPTPFGVGNELANRLTAGSGSQWLLGGGGNDTIDGGSGNDVLFGEAGADTFLFYRQSGGDPYAGASILLPEASGADVIGDFQPGTDKIRVLGYGITSFEQLKTGFVEVAGTTAINFGDGNYVVLNGIANAQLSAGDFLFS